jgi:hypothetical protein
MLLSIAVLCRSLRRAAGSIDCTGDNCAVELWHNPQLHFSRSVNIKLLWADFDVSSLLVRKAKMRVVVHIHPDLNPLSPGERRLRDGH